MPRSHLWLLASAYLLFGESQRKGRKSTVDRPRDKRHRRHNARRQYRQGVVLGRRGARPRWVAQDNTVTVAGRTIGGMVYAGRAPHSDFGWRHGNGFIDPRLRVSRAGTDLAGKGMPYWPRYADIGPAITRSLSGLAVRWTLGQENRARVCFFVFLRSGAAFFLSMSLTPRSGGKSWQKPNGYSKYTVRIIQFAGIWGRFWKLRGSSSIELPGSNSSPGSNGPVMSCLWTYGS